MDPGAKNKDGVDGVGREVVVQVRTPNGLVQLFEPVRHGAIKRGQFRRHLLGHRSGTAAHFHVVGFEPRFSAECSERPSIGRF